MEKTRTLFITVYDGLISKNILRSDAFRIIAAEKDLNIVLIVPAEKVEYYRREFGARATVEAAPPPSNPRTEAIFFWLMTYSTRTEGALYRIRAYAKNNLGKYVLTRLLRTLGTFRIWRDALSFCYGLLPDTSYDRMIEAHRPSLVFVANLLSSHDTRLMKAAKRRSIPAVGMVKSWDNVGNKPFLFLAVDELIVNNEIVRDEAKEILGFPEKRIHMVGFPQFDLYADRSFLMPREEFFAKIGIDPAKKLILYAATGFEWTPHEIEVLEALDAAIEKGAVAEPVEVLVRLHPKYDNAEERMRRLNHMRYERPGTTATGTKGGWEYERADVIHLMNSLFHADICINTASTMAIESMIFDRPTITIAFDGKHTLPFYESVRRFYTFPHNRKLVELGGEDVVHSEAELIESVNSYLSDPSRRADGRERTRQKECYQLDGKAGGRIAAVVLDTLHRVS